MSDDEKQASDDLISDWTEATAQRPELGQTVHIRLAAQQEPPYDRLPSEVKAVFAPHRRYQTPQFMPEWTKGDAYHWLLYVDPSQITHWRRLKTIPKQAPLRPSSPVIDSPPALYAPETTETKRRYALTPEGRASKIDKMRKYWQKRRPEANGDCGKKPHVWFTVARMAQKNISWDEVNFPRVYGRMISRRIR